MDGWSEQEEDEGLLVVVTATGGEGGGGCGDWREIQLKMEVDGVEKKSQGQFWHFKKNYGSVEELI